MKSISTHRARTGERLIGWIRSIEANQLRKNQETWELAHPESNDAWHVRIAGETQGPVAYEDVSHALLEGYGPVEVLHADQSADDAEAEWTELNYVPQWRKPWMGLVLTATLAAVTGLVICILGEVILPWPWELYFARVVGTAALVWWLLPFAAPLLAGKPASEGQVAQAKRGAGAPELG